MSRTISLLLTLGLLAGSTISLAQNSDPQALALAAQSIAAMTGGTSVNDVTLTGTAIWIAGSDRETGPATLTAKGIAESRVDLSLTNGLHSDIRNASGGSPQGATSIGEGSQQPWAFHNCLTDAAWFFPVLSSLGQTANSQYVFSYIGQETWNGMPVQHLRVYQLLGVGTELGPTLQRLSTTDFYLDQTSLLPLAISFKVHPDEDMNTDIPTEIRFADYRAVNGVLVPFRFQRLLNGSLLIDVTVSSATINSGLSDTQFIIQ